MEAAGDSVTQDDPVLGGRQDKAWALVMTDPQTGLPNQLVVHDRLSQALARQPRHGGEVVIINVILDNLEQINESHGFDVGNGVLLEAARRLTSTLRTEDTVGRTGKYELRTVVTVAQEANVEPLAARLRQMLEEPVAVDGGTFQLQSTLTVRIVDGSQTAG